LSISGLHYRYYKVQILCNTLSSLRCTIVNLVVRNSTPLDKWKKGLLLILKKSLGKIDISKLDFNAINKIIFIIRVIPSLEKKASIPREIMDNRQGKLAIYVALNKKLLVDIANQTKRSCIIISTDTSNSFNRVAYSIAGIVCHYFGLPIEYTVTFFTTI